VKLCGQKGPDRLVWRERLGLGRSQTFSLTIKNILTTRKCQDCTSLSPFTMNYRTAGGPGRGVVVCSKRHLNFGSNQQLKAVKL